MSDGDTIAIEIALVSLRVSTSAITRALALLDERERASAAARQRDVRRRYVIAHAAARIVIGARLTAEPEEVRITAEPGGRPVVDGVAFSLSHSGERCAIAIAAPGIDLGVDLERVRVRPHLDRLAQRVFAPAEYETWRALAPRARTQEFAQRWTEVEAVLKARGTGIAGSRPSGGLAGTRDLEPGWSCAAFDAGPGYVGAVAADAAPVVVSAHVLRLGDAFTRRGGTAR